eukprot:scaffold230929_cov25-Attheya_sp.AAC.1
MSVSLAAALLHIRHLTDPLKILVPHSFVGSGLQAARSAANWRKKEIRSRGSKAIDECALSGFHVPVPIRVFYPVQKPDLPVRDTMRRSYTWIAAGILPCGVMLHYELRYGARILRDSSER